MRYNKYSSRKQATATASFTEKVLITKGGAMYRFDGFAVIPFLSMYFGKAKNKCLYGGTFTEATEIQKALDYSRDEEAVAKLQAMEMVVVEPCEEIENLKKLMDSDRNFAEVAAGYGR